MEKKNLILKFIVTGGIHGQPRGDIMDKFGLSADRLSFYTGLLQQDDKVRVAGTYVIHHSHFEQLRKIIRELCKARGTIKLSNVREAVNAGRLFVVSILEYFDAEGMTVLSGEGRVLKDASD